MPSPDLATTETGSDRILALDFIRGVAVMGILLMNIVGFAMPEAAYSNPHAYGGHSGIDFAVWLANYILIDGKMRGLFSLLFGASLLLVTDRAEAKGKNPAAVHYARMAWLFVFGMLHLVLLWWGDILNHYALIGAVAFLFRKLPPHRLIALATILLIAEFAYVAIIGMQIADSEIAVRTGNASAETARMYIANRANLGIPSIPEISHDLVVHRGSYATVFADRLPAALKAPGQAFIFLGLETLAYMLLGMAALKSDLLTGAWSGRAYRWGAVIGLCGGAIAYALIATIPVHRNFDTASVAASDLVLSEPFRPLMILGWACLIILTIRPGSPITERVAAVGRMAFTNYIASTIICTTLFYGYGFGLYGRLSRAELYPIVAAIWVLMLAWSGVWLTRFRYGPLEWLWRSLARGQWQRMRFSATASQ